MFSKCPGTPPLLLLSSRLLPTSQSGLIDQTTSHDTDFSTRSSDARRRKFSYCVVLRVNDLIDTESRP
ncbi:hypothetical protein E2C01_057623 [Portunus trituberculatus]|uniref:Uncharacterized protein n=1 Tax=Portunus trituberculatus TaxID=210409 RepID=A0A5B7H1M3_PORTR|nr:hypothetical protein [Portunus trituberculatus]